MRFKKILTAGVVLSLMSFALVGCSSSSGSKESDTLKITMISDLGGINDQSFNQSAWEGLQKAEKELGVDVEVIQSKQVSDYAQNVETAVDNDSDLVIGIGFQMDEAIKEAAENYPDQKFAIIDHSYENQPKNVNSIMFNAEEASYLVGLIAGMKTETNTVGFIGGTKNPIIERFEYGFLAGVDDAGKGTKVLRQYADTYSDAAKGKAIANQMHSNNVDIIFTAAGDTGSGAIEAARENGKMAIGVDKDQNSLAPDNVITSAIKRVDMVVYNTVKDLVNGDFKGGEISVFGINEDGVGIAPTTDKNVNKEILAFVKEQTEKVKKGEITIPVNQKEYDNRK
ncbi:BMP family lipoprotein [Romboutsia sp. 1001713B170131_170501_G6]|uniref:BMP family lipoprotein n=1 Tax=Romboutsia sp. 1001713B170131_170501_G6 TaxID=2787108 RepID=UPI0018AA7DE1|nr:BMP family ABC transporter substrate-binding protein [Romboutsia sp. 1001713B170131_170501_G6]